MIDDDPIEIATELEALTMCFDVHPEPGTEEVPVVLVPQGHKLVVPEELIRAVESRRARPRRRVGSTKHDELDTFCAYVNRYKTEDSVLFADLSKFELAAVLNYHPPQHPSNAALAGWADHVAVYRCPRSLEWQTWAKREGEMFSQAAFGDFLEEQLEYLTDDDGFPPPAALVEMARDLQINTKGTFKRKLNPSTGESQLICSQEHGDTSTRIPRAFLLALRVFEGGQAYKVEARLRMSLEGDIARFSYILHRRAEIERDAFQGARETAVEATGLPLFAGAAER